MYYNHNGYNKGSKVMQPFPHTNVMHLRIGDLFANTCVVREHIDMYNSYSYICLEKEPMKLIILYRFLRVL